MAVIEEDGTVVGIFTNCSCGCGRVGVQHLIFCTNGLELVEISREDDGDAAIYHVMSSSEFFQLLVEFCNVASCEE
eukprot:scaffold21401_cov80-Skeletonema_marinoi.AAC.2